MTTTTLLLAGFLLGWVARSIWTIVKHSIYEVDVKINADQAHKELNLLEERSIRVCNYFAKINSEALHYQQGLASVTSKKSEGLGGQYGS